MCFITVISSLSQAIPAPPAKFSPCLCRGWKKNITLHHLHSIRIIILRNALQSPWEVRGMKHRGNHLPPVIISHPSAVLEEDPGGLGGSHVQPTDRQRKGLSWLQCPESISDLSRLLAALQLLWGLAAHEHQPYVLSVRRPLIHTELVTPKMRELLKIPEQAPFGFLKNPPGGWSVECWDPVRICEHFLKGAALWEIEDNQKFLKGVRLFIADGQKKQKHWSNSCAHEVSVLWMSWQPYKSMGDWQSSSDEYLCFEFLFLPWDLHLSPIQICIFFFQWTGLKGRHFLKIQRLYALQPLKIHD